MSQTWTTEIPAAETLSTSRTTINDNFDALRSCFIGPADPGGTISGQIWINTTDNKVYMRGVSSNIEIGTYNEANLGHLSTSGGTVLGTIDMDENRIINLPETPTGNQEAVSKAYADLLLPKSGGSGPNALTGDVYSWRADDSAPSTIAVLAQKGYVDTKISLAGGTMTDASLFLIADNQPATAGTQALGRNEISAFLNFNTSSGHRHDGTDARKILASDLDPFGSTSNQVLVSNGPAVDPTWQTVPGAAAVGSYTGTGYYDAAEGAHALPNPVVPVNGSQVINSSDNPDITFPVRYVEIRSGLSAMGTFISNEHGAVGHGGHIRSAEFAANCVWRAWWNPDSGTGYGTTQSYGRGPVNNVWTPSTAGALIHLDGTTQGFEVNLGASIPYVWPFWYSWEEMVESGYGGGPNLGGSAGKSPDETRINTYHYVCRG